MLNIEASVTVEGCDVHYWDTGGDGTAVVFSHGAGADHLMFRPQVEHLAGHGYRVVTWDLRGHGRSRPGGAPFTAERAAGDLVALLDHLELERPVLAGQSLGGNLAQAVVRQRPGRARGLIVMDSTCNTGPLSRAERVLLRAALPVLSVIPARRLPAMMANASAVTDQGRAYALRVFGQLPKQEFLAAWRATVELVDPDPAYRTPVPLCLIRGERDRTGNIATAMPRWARAEGIQETVIPGAGHLVNLDAPGAVNSAILAFLRTGLES
ncbi:alpha/beta fold hydrolase [Nonomuraea cavernae]|uniref:alpha/beta fold hydrolase n=1 Tax=Nonomuraea cavernae TaxID=2045107 RepID=UPI0033E84923